MVTRVDPFIIEDRGTLHDDDFSTYGLEVHT